MEQERDGEGGCVELLYPWGESSASPVPHRSTVSQPTVLWPHPLSPSLQLYFRLPRSPALPKAFAVPASPYANCSSEACLSLVQPACLSFPPAIIPLLLCLRLCPSAHPAARDSFWPIVLSRKAARLSAAEPICPTSRLSIHHLFAFPPIHLPVYLLAFHLFFLFFVLGFKVLYKRPNMNSSPHFMPVVTHGQKDLLTWQENGDDVHMLF